MLRAYCPACGSSNCSHLISMGEQPMSLVAMQSDASQSDNLERYPITIFICSTCCHCFNVSFLPDVQKYTGAGCRMWNKGQAWKQHIKGLAASVELQNPYLDSIIEIGAGDGEFLAMINSDAKKTAIDPADSVEHCASRGLNFIKEYFDAKKHINESAGNTLIVMRHLLEHMEDPFKFLTAIAESRIDSEHNTLMLVEVPCIEIALENTRLEDWTYEHPQHFTHKSLKLLMQSVGFSGETSHKYGGEVLVFFGALYTSSEAYLDDYAKIALKASKVVRELNATDSIAYWGGAGKSALFLNYFKVRSDTIVVDSDPAKVGLCVPGTTIKIQSPEVLLTNPVKTIVVTTSWRAEDIKREINTLGITCDRTLTFERGKLIEV